MWQVQHLNCWTCLPDVGTNKQSPCEIAQVHVPHTSAANQSRSALGEEGRREFVQAAFVPTAVCSSPRCLWHAPRGRNRCLRSTSRSTRRQGSLWLTSKELRLGGKWRQRRARGSIHLSTRCFLADVAEQRQGQRAIAARLGRLGRRGRALPCLEEQSESVREGARNMHVCHP
jgi:hypothetical protein